MRVAVFGAGYAGLTVARRLEDQLPDDVEIVVVDESDSHLVRHELHRVIRHPDLEETITVPLENVFSRATVRQARVTDIDTEANVATLKTSRSAETERLEFDFGAVCLGSQTAFYDLPGVEEYATPLNRLKDARHIRQDALAAAGGEAVIGGAGLSGIQTAGELAELSAEEGLDLSVTLVEMADRIAPMFEEEFAEAIRQELEARDVTIETGASVESADADAVHLAENRSLPYEVFVWTGGIRGTTALDSQRPAVDETLRVDGDTFVVGDAGNVTGAGGETAAASAQSAIRQAPVAAKNIVRLVNATRVTDEGAGEDDEPRLHTYTYETPGWAVSIGDGAVARVGSVILSGEPARAAKAVIGAGHLASVGAIQQASTLVHGELGWPKVDALKGFDTLWRKAEEVDVTRGADPATPTEYEQFLLGTALALAEEFGADGTVDATEVTRLTDREYPGSPANLLQRVVTDSVETAVSLGTLGLGDSEDE